LLPGPTTPPARVTHHAVRSAAATAGVASSSQFGCLFAEDEQIRTRASASVLAPTGIPDADGYESLPARRVRDLRALPGEDIAAMAGDGLGQAVGPPTAPSGEVPLSWPGERRHPLLSTRPAARARSRSHRQGRIVYTVRSAAGGQPAGHTGRRRHRAGRVGNIAVDDEGNAPARNVLIENGVLTDYMWTGCGHARRSEVLGQRPSTELPAPPHGADDEHVSSRRAEDPEEIVAQTLRVST